MKKMIGWIVGLVVLPMALAAQGFSADTQAGKHAVEIAHAHAGLEVSVDGVSRIDIPLAWADGDPGDTLYRQAREAMNAGEFSEAASLFEELRNRFPASEYTGDALYFEAFARYRLGSRRELDRAGQLLEQQLADHPDAGTAGDAEGLRVRVRSQLARIGNSRAMMDVASQAAEPCDSDDQELKTMAVSALMGMDRERAGPLLTEILQQRDECSEELRAMAVFILGQHMDENLVATMLDVVVNDPDPSEEVRQAAVFALSQSNSEEAFDALEQLLLTSTDEEIVQHALMALSNGSPRHLMAVRSFALRDNVDADLRATAIFMVGNRGDDSYDFLVEIYQESEDEGLREAAIMGLSQSQDPRVTSWLLDLARDTSQPSEARKNALFWWGQKENRELGELTGLYNEFDDPEFKEAVLFALAQHPNEAEVVGILIEIAKTEDDKELAAKALFWLGQSKDPRVPALLLEIIRR